MILVQVLLCVDQNKTSIYSLAFAGPEGFTSVAPAAARTVAFLSFTFVAIDD